MYQVESGIEIPSSGGNGRYGKYPWRKLDIGDSFFVKRNDFSKEDYRPSPPGYMDMKIVTRKLCEGGIWGVRVWRIK